MMQFMNLLPSPVRAFVRIFFFVFIVVAYLMRAGALLLLNKNLQQRRKKLAANTQFFTIICLRVFKISVHMRGQQNIPDGNYLLVSNHMGFIDILAISSKLPLLFVTSQEMRETPFLGLLTEMGGCIYVERRNRTGILGELKSIAEALKQGHSIVLYPEATSGDGEKVLPFKKTLIMAAAHAGVPILPAVINFTSINKGAFDLNSRDAVCWYGDITFIVSLWRALGLSELSIDVEVLPPQYFTPEQDRGLVANQLHEMISARFQSARPSPQQVAQTVDSSL